MVIRNGQGDPSAGGDVVILFARTVVVHTAHGYIDRQVDEQHSDRNRRTPATPHIIESKEGFAGMQ
jgi:hypothetical protein